MPDQTTLERTQEPESRRDMLAAALTAAEPVEQQVEVTQEQQEQRARDEAGRFAAKVEKAEPVAEPVPVVEVKPRLTTWKKEYLPLADKLAQGVPLTPDEAKRLDAYNIQRETEYSTGISVFKDRATRLEHIEKAIEPFMPELQKHNIAPDQWIGNLGRAHHTLALGSDEQKLQMFLKLAGDYKVPLAQLIQQNGQGSEQPSAYGQLLERYNALEQRINGVTQWQDQLQQREVTSTLSKFDDAEKYPHFEKVRGTMAQLLESGLAPDLDTAYAQAEWTVPEVRELKLAALSQGAQAQVTQRQAITRAKAAAVSPRSATPSGVTANSSTKDRRALIAEALDAHAGRV